MRTQRVAAQARPRSATRRILPRGRRRPDACRVLLHVRGTVPAGHTHATARPDLGAGRRGHRHLATGHDHLGPRPLPGPGTAATPAAPARKPRLRDNRPAHRQHNTRRPGRLRTRRPAAHLPAHRNGVDLRRRRPSATGSSTFTSPAPASSSRWPSTARPTQPTTNSARWRCRSTRHCKRQAQYARAQTLASTALIPATEASTHHPGTARARRPGSPVPGPTLLTSGSKCLTCRHRFWLPCHAGSGQYRRSSEHHVHAGH